MKSNYLIINTLATLLISGVYHSINAQCSPSIPNDANVSAGAFTQSGLSNVSYWVCSGSNLISASSFTGPTNKTVFLESGSTFTTNSTASAPDQGSNTIYAKSGSTVNIDAISSNNTIYYESGATITSAGTTPTQIPCTVLSFDYSNAPSTGCTTGVNDLAAQQPVFYITKEANFFTVNYTTVNEAPKDLKMYDIVGNILLQENINTNNFTKNIDASSFPKGVYLLTITSGKERHTKKIIVE